MVPASLQEQLKKAVRPGYWRELNPQLTVGRATVDDVADLGQPPPPAALAGHLEQLGVEGYFLADGCLPEALMTRMRDAIIRVRAEGWHPIFAFIYDEFWMVTRAPALRALLRGILGPGYQQRPRVWTYFVETGTGTPSAGSSRGSPVSGWGPHIDADEPIFGPDGRPKVVSIWIPLTDANEHNGCMYVVPSNLFAGTSIFATVPMPDTMPAADAVAMLHVSRALPARAGSIIGWHQNLIHWGSISTPRARGPRMSIALEFQLPDAALAGSGRVPIVWDPEVALPTLRRRLRVIGYASTVYLSHSEPYHATPERILLGQALLSLS